jgi:hypothetical protein
LPDNEPTVAERAVARFHEAKAALLEFLGDPELKDILLEYEQLVTNHNQELDAAMRAIKSELRGLDQDKLIIEGLGAQKKYKRYYDAEFLANTLPADQADEVLHEEIVYRVDKDRLDQLCRQGEIDNEIVDRAYHEDEQNPANMPGTPKAYAIPAIPLDDG